jgi:hypothetical protein
MWIDGLIDDSFPFLIFCDFLDTDSYDLMIVWKEWNGWWYFFGGFPCEEVDIKEDSLAEISLSFIYHCWDGYCLHFGDFFIEELVD